MEERPVRKSVRLKEYDYSALGAYFITICTQDRRCILSDILVGAGVLDGPHVRLTAVGRIVDEIIQKMDGYYDHVSVDRYVIMPNHIHLLIRVSENGSSRTPTPTNAVIPSFVSYLKRATNKRCGASLWQRSYYDHVARNEEDLRQIWEYIDGNPARWAEDRFYMPQ